MPKGVYERQPKGTPSKASREVRQRPPPEDYADVASLHWARIALRLPYTSRVTKLILEEKIVGGAHLRPGMLQLTWWCSRKSVLAYRNTKAHRRHVMMEDRG